MGLLPYHYEAKGRKVGTGYYGGALQGRVLPSRPEAISLNYYSEHNFLRPTTKTVSTLPMYLSLSAFPCWLLEGLCVGGEGVRYVYMCGDWVCPHIIRILWNHPVRNCNEVMGNSYKKILITSQFD